MPSESGIPFKKPEADTALEKKSRCRQRPWHAEMNGDQRLQAVQGAGSPDGMQLAGRIAPRRIKEKLETQDAGPFR